MDKTTLINYIKSNFPKIIFNPLKLTGTPSRSIGFIVSDNKIIIGYINKEGNLCRLFEPVDLNGLSSEKFIEILNRIPIVSGFDENNKVDLINLLSHKDTLSITEDEHNNVIKELNNSSKYNILLEENKVILIKKEYEDSLLEIKSKFQDERKEFNEKIKDLEDTKENCKNRLLSEKDQIILGIKNYKKQVSDYIDSIMKSNGVDSKSFLRVNEMYNKLLEEKSIIDKNMEVLTIREKDNLKVISDNKSVISNYSDKLNNQQDEILNLNNTILEISNELNVVKEQFESSKLENNFLSEFKKNCIKVILEEKELIIEKIKEYNTKWLTWSENNKYDIDEQKSKLNTELELILVNLKKVINTKSEYINSLDLSVKDKQHLLSKLNENVSEIKVEVNTALNRQLIELNMKSQLVKENLDNEIKNKDIIIKDLHRKLDNAKLLLNKNENTVLKGEVDYKNCYETLQKFINVNNMFYRKKEIILILDSIINDESKSSTFLNLNENMRLNIKNKFDAVKAEINKHINFLDLAKYINSPNIQLFKSKSTLKSIPDNFCVELSNISDYWDNNIDIFTQQDIILTNIYEDLSGAVRVYIRIKPFLGNQKNDTVYIESNTKKITVDCTNTIGYDKKETFGNFYGVFDESFTNKDIYFGSQNLNVEDEIESIHPGLQNTFKQVEEGYSIVLFGYGVSGSGKSFLLLGEKSSPGLINYGLQNLKNVKNIKIKYLFEQYIDKFIPTLHKIKGKIINLVREVPQLRKYSIDETKEFADYIKDTINLNDINVSNVNDINNLTRLLEDYRKEHNRIKMTPNNNVSSRSNLYIVFEISFESGKVGYITIVDTAGKESPNDIYNLFIDVNKGRTNLTSLLGPTSSNSVTEYHMKDEYKKLYTPSNVLEILREGFYINECLDHLIYFFNKKNYKKTKVILQTTLDKYSESKYYVNPIEEEVSIDQNNNCLMIPILKFLDALSNKKSEIDDFRPTKFSMIVCVRKDEMYCPQIFSSLKFAQQIKST